MPTLLNGLVYFSPNNGVIIKYNANEVQPDELSHAIKIAHDFLEDCPECKECIFGWRGPFVPECNCDLPLDKVLLLRDNFRADPDGRIKWKKRNRDKRNEYETWRRNRAAQKRAIQKAHRDEFGPTRCPYWKTAETGHRYCEKEKFHVTPSQEV